MPAFETMDLHQTAVLWTKEGTDDYGQPLRSATGEEISVRWETGRRQGLDGQGSVVAHDASVVVDRLVGIGSLMWLGTFDDLPGTGTPNLRTPDSDVMEVVDYYETPDIKNRNIRRVVKLIRHSDTIPDSA